MADEFVPAPWAFMIDTDSYAGNFERELCAWVTGQLGECEVGVRHAEAAIKDAPADFLKWCADNIVGVPDDHGCFRPVTGWLGPYSDHEYNSVAIFFRCSPPVEMCKIMMERARRYPVNLHRFHGNTDFKVKGFRVVHLELKETVLWSSN
jgi:hypothetical protein